MARSDSGKWVARAAATGGGRTYRGQRPVKWYFSLFLICVLGVALIAYSRYERQHPASSGPPTTSDHWYAAYGVDICGVNEPALASPPNASTAGITTTGDGLIHIAPKSSADTGANATLGRFVQLYSGLKLTSTTIRYPGAKTSTTNHTFTLGDKCPKGTPDAGKAGELVVQQWPNAAGNPSAIGKTGPQTVGHPSQLRLQNGQLIAIGFVPHGTKLAKPPAIRIEALLKAMTGTSTPTSPTVSVPTTTPGSTTTPPGSTTTTPASPTTAPASTPTTSGSPTTTKP